MKVFPSRPEPTTCHDLDDAGLMERIARQDQESLLVLYERYGGQVYGLVLKILRDPGLAEEATQDTFLKVWHRGSTWDPGRGRLASWLLAVARHTAIDRLRREQRQAAVVAAVLEQAEGLQPDNPIMGDTSWHDAQLLRSLLRQLPREQAQVIELAFFHGFTHSELAELLDWPLGTVKTRIRLGLQRLRHLWLEATRQR